MTAAPRHQHTEAELKRAENYIVRAKEAFAAGFYAETHRKDAKDYLARAYDTLVKYGFNYIVWNTQVEDPATGRWSMPNKAWEKLSYANFPDLHVWARNPDKFAKIYADFPEVVKRGNELAALRNQFDAAELTKKPKSKTQIKKEERAAEAKTCQICGRPILAETGVIAHHGYQRPSHIPGLQTASCYGARELEFEKSRDALGAYLGIQRNRLGSMVEVRSQINREKIPLHFSYWNGKYDNRHESIDIRVEVTRATFDKIRAEHAKQARSVIPNTFDDLKETKLRGADRGIADLKRYIDMQQSRYDGWKAVV